MYSSHIEKLINREELNRRAFFSESAKAIYEVTKKMSCDPS